MNLRAPVVASLVLAAVGGCAPAPDPVEEPPAPVPSDQVGPYEVGATTLRFVDDRGKFLAIEVWYPATPQEGAVLEPYEELQVVAATYRDAPEDLRGAPYPLVAFSHGYSGIRYQSSYLMTHLASHGFVVAAVDHIGNTLLDLDEEQTNRVAAERPADISVAVDIVGELLPRLVEPDDGFAMVGHSFGAWTTLVVGGGVIDHDYLLQHCAEQDERGCRFLVAEEDAEPADLSQAVPDPRARVAVSMAPGLAYSFGAGGSGLAANVPTLVQGGTADSDMPYETEIRPVFAALPAGSALASLTDAGHFGFSDLCLILPLDECAGAEDGWMEAERAHELSRVLATAWIRSKWLGETSQEVFLTPDWVEAEGDATWEGD